MSPSFRAFMFWVGLIFVVAPVTSVVLKGVGLPDGIQAFGALAAVVGVAWWRSKRKKDAIRRDQLRAAAQADALATEAKIRAASPWMDDPDDYRPLPKMPDLTKLPDDVANEYVRKYNLRKEAAKRVDREITEEKILHGTEYTPEQREVLIQRECRQMQSTHGQVEFEVEQDQANRRKARREHQETLDAIENSTQFGRSRRFKQDHPFLSGLMGNENVDKLTSQGWWKG